MALTTDEIRKAVVENNLEECSPATPAHLADLLGVPVAEVTFSSRHVPGTTVTPGWTPGGRRQVDGLVPTRPYLRKLLLRAEEMVTAAGITPGLARECIKDEVP